MPPTTAHSDEGDISAKYVEAILPDDVIELDVYNFCIWNVVFFFA